MRWIWFLLGSGLAACVNTAERDRAAVREAMEKALRPQRNMGEISKRFGTGPKTCAPVSPGKQMCTWEIESQETWHVTTGPFTAPVDRGWQLVIFCELPTDGSDREPNSCSYTLTAGGQRITP